MRNRLPAVCFATMLPVMAAAQGTVFVSNLDETPTRSALIGSDAWIAQPFYIFATDPNTYALDHVQLLLNPASGDSRGFAVSIYSASNNIPQTKLGDLSGSDDPSAGGIYTYSASGIDVSSAADYYVVVHASTPVAQGSYSWSGVSTPTQNGTWVISARAFSSSDGLSWTVLDRQEVFQIAIHAAMVPEPTTGAVALLVLGGIAFWRRRI